MVRVNSAEIETRIAEKKRELKRLQHDINMDMSRKVMTGMQNVFTQNDALCESWEHLTVEDGERLALKILDQVDIFGTVSSVADNADQNECCMQDEELVLEPNTEAVVDEKPTAPVKQKVFKSRGQIPDGIYMLNHKVHGMNQPVVARASVKNGEWTILPGSMIAPMSTSGKPFEQYRKDAEIVNGILLTSIRATSPSNAAGICLGCVSSGYRVWKNDAGQPIDIYRE